MIIKSLQQMPMIKHFLMETHLMRQHFHRQKINRPPYLINRQNLKL